MKSDRLYAVSLLALLAMVMIAGVFQTGPALAEGQPLSVVEEKSTLEAIEQSQADTPQVSSPVANLSGSSNPFVSELNTPESTLHPGQRSILLI